MNGIKKALLSVLFGSLRELLSPAVKRIIAEEVLIRLEEEAKKTRNTWDDFFARLLRRAVAEG